MSNITTLNVFDSDSLQGGDFTFEANIDNDFKKGLKSSSDTLNRFQCGFSLIWY